MKISYLVTVHNEAKELEVLLKKLYKIVEGTSDEIVILDDYSDDFETRKLLEFHKCFSSSDSIGKVVQHHLDGDFGEHKNFGNSHCTGEYIVQLDADEYMSDTLADNIHLLIESNPTVDLYRVPRVNIVRGLTPEDANRWGWHVCNLSEFGDLPIVNWISGDRQSRIYKNLPHIKWTRKLHEVVTGAEMIAELPIDINYSFIHDKTIERQTKQNEFYMKNWTHKENTGQ